LLAVFAQGCGEPEAEPTVTFQALAEPDTREYRLLKAVVAEFQRQHAGVKVLLTGERLKLNYLTRSIIAGQAADVIEVRAEEVGRLAETRTVRPLTAECINLVGAWHPRARRSSTQGNEYFAIPWAARPKLLLYNKAAFRAAGLPDDQPPRTWEEWERTACDLTRDTDDDGVVDTYGFALAARRSVDLGKHFATFLAQLDLRLIEERDDLTTFHVGGPGAKRVMDLLLGLKDCAPRESVVTDNRRALRQFHSGEAAMVLAGPAGLWPSVPGVSPEDIGVADVPIPADGWPACNEEFRYACVPASVPEERLGAALELATFMASPEAQAIVAGGADGCRPVIPIRLDVLEGDWCADRPELASFARALQNGAPTFPWLIWQGKCLEDWLGGIHSLLVPISEARGNRSVDEVMTVAQTKGNRALSCLYTTIGHPSWTMRLGMVVAGLAVFLVVAYAVSRH